MLKMRRQDKYINIYVCVLSQSYPLSAIPWTAAHWVPLSMGFSRQEYWSGLPFLPVGDLPNPVIEPPISCVSYAGRQTLPLRHLRSPYIYIYTYIYIYVTLKQSMKTCSTRSQESATCTAWQKKTIPRHIYFGQHDYQLLVPDCSGGYT